MSLKVGQVPGAAGSGTKFAPYEARAPKPDWTCANGHDCKGCWTRCLTAGCNERRPR